jgi:hypothetical protein
MYFFVTVVKIWILSGVFMWAFVLLWYDVFLKSSWGEKACQKYNSRVPRDYSKENTSSKKTPELP